jgi:hypothetical protein
MPTATRPRADARPVGSTVLVGDPDCEACCGRLAAADAALVVAFDATPREWFAARDARPGGVQFVATYPHPDCERVLADPGDLTAFALAVGEFLDALPEDAAPAVCLDDLDAALAYAAPSLVARFLSVVAGRVRAVGGSLHAHAASKPAALPNETVLVAE